MVFQCDRCHPRGKQYLRKVLSFILLETWHRNEAVLKEESEANVMSHIKTKVCPFNNS